MDTVASADGTVIAFDRYGEGPPVTTTAGAFNTRSTAEPLASQFTALNHDRRGRANSGDTPPYAVEREIDDIAGLPGSARRPSRQGSRPQTRRHRAGDSRIPHPLAAHRACWCRLPVRRSDEHAPHSVVGERLAGEASAQSLHLKAGDVEQADPLVLGRPPQRDRRAVLTDVDPVAAHRVAGHMRHRLPPALTVEPDGNLTVEGDGEGEAFRRTGPPAVDSGPLEHQKSRES
jgi:hypothetical protein